MTKSILTEKRTADFRQATRVHGSFLAAAEKRALIYMAERMPAWVNSDHLTLLGFAAQIATGVCYALAGRDRRMLLVAIVCLALNWFGDSLDGTLARVRQQQRPRYGFYVDHMIDSIRAVAMMGGLALSGYMHPVIAIGLLIAFLLLSVQSYLVDSIRQVQCQQRSSLDCREPRIDAAAGRQTEVQLHPVELCRNSCLLTAEFPARRSLCVWC